MSSSASATPPRIPGSLQVDTLQVNNVTKLIGEIVGNALSELTSWKTAVRVATTGNITLSAAQTIDGVAVVAGDRVLVKNQGTASENGIYIVQISAWYRADDMVAGSSASGAATIATAGTVGNDQIFICTNAAGAGVVGTDNLVFATLSATATAAGSTTQVQYNLAGVFAGAANLTITGGNVVVPTGNVNVTLGDVNVTAGDVTLGTAGGKLNIATGANASIGTATIVNGQTAIVVATEAVLTASKIFVTPIETLGTASFFFVNTIVNGTSFTINVNADPGADVDFNWLIIN